MADSTRLHIVFVPGFVGFDALGQLEYYAGVTPLFQQWRAREGPRRGVTLHYFDNYPTASVATRAGRLLRYLAKRMARGEFAPGDELVLVGHSTGGLDIRHLLWELGNREENLQVDGSRRQSAAVRPRDLFEMVRKVVFLSVPHWGTNIADWVRDYGLARRIAIGDLRALVAGAQVPLLDQVEEAVAGGAAEAGDVDLLRAVRDSLTEADATQPDRVAAAEAREAASELELWLRQMWADFTGLDDLTAGDGEPGSPAHFSDEQRAAEQRLWRDAGIRVRSYATLGRPMFRFQAGRPAPRWELLKPWSYPGLGEGLVYRTCYRACAGGPFGHAAPYTPACLTTAQQRRIEEWKHGGGIELWDNDGIVNTASMLWPQGDTVLVPGDHMDIVGHYRLEEAQPGGSREYQAYDLLQSGSGFDRRTFRDVWRDVLGFCAGARAGAAAA